MLQRVLEESAPVLVAARLDAEERRTNIRLREEQDAAYRAALEADQVCHIFKLVFAFSLSQNLGFYFINVNLLFDMVLMRFLNPSGKGTAEERRARAVS